MTATRNIALPKTLPSIWLSSLQIVTTSLVNASTQIIDKFVVLDSLAVALVIAVMARGAAGPKGGSAIASMGIPTSGLFPQDVFQCYTMPTSIQCVTVLITSVLIFPTK